ncbi:hypothetical protein [Sediminibacterium sp.]|uniref:hypothetical protein n=1 Tax=Sediminibacterium sp. TaxID=1917865 RepID=UPI003F6EC3D3
MKNFFFIFYFVSIIFTLNAQNLNSSLPELTNSPFVESPFSSSKPPFQLYWKSKDGNFLLVNDKSSAIKKIKQYQLYYSFLDKPMKEMDFVSMPIHFNTKQPVQIKQLSPKNWLLQFVGLNEKIYQSAVSAYNAARWMEQFLDPPSSKLSLKDIVIPGSHDAGMSVLTATGGQQKGTINACNTLTQQISIDEQLNQGIRMFDLRVGMYNQMLYTKHAASDCMEDAIGGGYGERLKTVAVGLKKFLQVNSKEIVLISFSHFCEKEAPLQQLQDSLINWIGEDQIYKNTAVAIADVPLKHLSGKVILSFEIPNWNHSLFPRCDMNDTSTAFINFRRAYASTNDMKKLMQTEQDFFNKLQTGVSKNDIIRLDWQITQSADEASAVCNDFQDEKLNPIVNGAILLANMIRKNKSIIDHAKIANQQLPIKMNEWILNKTITNKNKPNIIYVDAAGAWVTDYCIYLMQSPLYSSN